MNKIFVTSDIWFNRPNGKMSEYNTHEYNDIIINNWNKTVNKKDIVYILGGIGISDMYHILLKLNGEIHILNNFFTQDELFFRDTIIESLNKSVDKKINEKIIFENSQIIIIPEQDVILSYFPLMDWYGSDTGTFSFHGFLHDSDLSNNRICCSMEYWNYKPILISEIQSNIKKFRKNI